MKRQLLGLALGVALLGASSAQALIIDSFTTPQGPIAIPPGASSLSAPDVINPAWGIAGTRSLSAETTSGLGGTAQVIFGMTNGFFNLNANSTTVTTVTVVWQTAAGAAGNVDLTDGGTSDFLIFGVDSLDHPLTVSVTLVDGDGTTATNVYYKHNTQVITGTTITGQACDPNCPQILGSIFGDPSTGVFGNYYHALDSFNGLAPTIDPATGLAFGVPSDGVGSLDLTNIDRIEFALTTTGDGLDFLVDCLYTGGRASTGTQSPADGTGQTYPTFDTASTDGDRNHCHTVPEPASMLLMGAGLLGLGLVSMGARLRRQA